MLVKNLTAFPFGTKLTSRNPPQPELMVAVRGRFRLMHGAAMELDVAPDHDPGVPDLVTQGSLSMETFAEDDEQQLGAPLGPNDLADFKLRGEVMVLGTCHAPKGRPTKRTTVGLTVSNDDGPVVNKLLAVVGHRAWSDRLVGAHTSDPLPFTEMRVCYDNAFGGEGYVLNPVGKGAVGTELPNIESPAQLIRAPSDQPPPAGLGPLNPGWPQRAGARGNSYGSKWEKTRAPFYSDDFDWSYFQCAPADQQIDGYFSGTEELTLHHLSPERAVLRTRLPGLQVRVFVKRESDPVAELKMSLDTVFVDADEQVAYLTWRGLMAVGAIDHDDVTAVLIASEPKGESTAADVYEAQLEAFVNDPTAFESETKAALEAEHAAGMARLEATKAAWKGLGKGGDGALGGEVALLVDAAAGNKDSSRTETLTRSIDEGFAAGADQQPDAASAVQAFQSKPDAMPKPDPFPLRPPKDALGARPMPEVVAALEDARDKSLAAEAQAKSANDGAAPSNGSKPASATLQEFIDSPLVAGLRGPPVVAPEPGADLSRQDFREQDLRGVDFTGCNLTEALLTRADLRGAILRDCDLSYAVLYGANLEQADLSGANLLLANFTEANCKGATLTEARADRTIFEDTMMESADLSGMSATFTLFLRTKLDSAVLRGAVIEESLFDGVSMTRIDAKKTQMTSCLIKDGELRAAVFEKARLDKTSFQGSMLNDAIFVGAVAEQPVFLDATMDGCDFDRVLFRRAFFNGASAKKATFVRAYLKGSRFYRTNLDSASFAAANLYDVDFRHAVLDGVSLEGANLFQADLSGAWGRNTRLMNANLKRCKLPS